MVRWGKIWESTSYDDMESSPEIVLCEKRCRDVFYGFVKEWEKDISVLFVFALKISGRICKRLIKCYLFGRKTIDEEQV